MEKIKIIIIAFFASVIFMGCASSSKVVYSWVNSENFGKKEYKKIFIMALTEDRNAQTLVENSFIEPIRNLGIDVVTGNQSFQKTFTKSSLPAKEEILKKVSELKCDLIFLISLLDSKSETRYVPGSYYHAPYPRYGYYGMFGTYYGYWTGVIYEPGYYTTQNTYFLEGNLFDAATENILWSVQSRTYDPRDIQSFSKEYCRLVINQAMKDGVIKKIN